MEITEEALEALRVKEVANGRAAVVPDGYGIQSLVGTLDAPPRKMQHIRLLDLETLTDCVKREDSDSSTKSVLYVDSDKIHAVFNHYNQDGSPGWCDDIAVMNLTKTVEWTNWMDKNERALGQKEFVEFIEENYKDIIDPSSADMLTFASKFNMSRKVEYKSAYRVSDGETKILYDETTEAKSGEIKMMNEFTISIPVIQGAEKFTTYALKVRLKVRLTEEKKLIFIYSIVRPDIPERNSVKDLSDQLSIDLPENRVIRGCVYRTTRQNYSLNSLG